MEINEIVKEKWRLLLVEQNSSKQLSQKKTLKNQNKPRKKLQNKSFLWDFWYGISWNLRIWQYPVELQNADGRGQIHDDGYMSHPVESSKRRKQLDDGSYGGTMTVTEWRLHKLRDDDTNSRKRVKTVKTGVFFAFGENFKMLNVVICVLRHFLGDWQRIWFRDG